MSSVVYAREFDLPVDDYIRVVGDSTLGPGRPLDDRERVARMIRGADLIVSARIDGECVGIGRPHGLRLGCLSRRSRGEREHQGGDRQGLC